jgi:hypothetical protein
MGERKAYPSDLTEEQWAVVGPFLDAWKVNIRRCPGIRAATRCGKS